MKLTRSIKVPKIHPCLLKQFKGVQGDGGDSEGFDEDKWLCDGVWIYKGGCKSGHKRDAFDYYTGMQGWRCSKANEEECDFDICEMCVRWALHCDKNSLELGLTRE